MSAQPKSASARARARRRLGRRGEAKAARYLMRRGLRVLERNWRCPTGELDIIARDGDVLVIVEVRSASGRFAGGPECTVGPDKQRRLARLAQRYRATLSARGGGASRGHTGWRPASVRFDVVGVVRRAWWRWEVRWVRNAFDVPAT